MFTKNWQIYTLKKVQVLTVHTQNSTYFEKVKMKLHLNFLISYQNIHLCSTQHCILKVFFTIKH